MKKIHGNADGLKSDQKRRIENLYKRQSPSEFIITPEICREMSELSHEIRRQIGLLISRSGKVIHVIIGDQHQIFIPELKDYRLIPGKLLGLKCVHTHLKNEPLSQDDLTDLALLRLDLMAAVTMTEEGRPHQIHTAHVTPASSGAPHKVSPPLYPGGLQTGSLNLINEIEATLTKKESHHKASGFAERAILVSVATGSRKMAMDALDELTELALSCDIQVLDTVFQMRKKVDPRMVLGKGKISDITILAMQKGATILIFDQELNPSQIRTITDQVAIKVIDRTQMILDIFARRARTREGKLQVELAQLKYMLPRLGTQNTAMSRLTGGIGGRGPGETKLELNRRRVRDRIGILQKAIDRVKKQRTQQKSLRSKKGVPVISIVGYTNAGKSTLLNTLTQSSVLVEDKLFATLDPSSRRLRFPRDIEVIITDTVGFIRDLPKDLMVSFRATLEELENADLLLHVVDMSSPRYREQIESVNRIIEDLNLTAIPTIIALNKADLVDDEDASTAIKQTGGIPVSASCRPSLLPLLHKMENIVEPLVEFLTTDGDTPEP